MTRQIVARRNVVAKLGLAWWSLLLAVLCVCWRCTEGEPHNSTMFVAAPAECTGGYCCKDGKYVAKGTVCRSPLASCELNAECTGSDWYCPGNPIAPSGTMCLWWPTLECMETPYCNGTSRYCPTPRFSSAEKVCRRKSGPCDCDTKCTGDSYLCPSTNYYKEGYVCERARGPCEKDGTCSGWSSGCRPRTFVPTGTLCRESRGKCEVDSHCTGNTTECPPSYRPPNFICSASQGPCQLDIFCTGRTVSCPPDEFRPKTTVCSPSQGPCQNNVNCTGYSAPCDPSFKPSNYMCRRRTGPCEDSVLCTGTTAACNPSYWEANSTCSHSPESCSYGLCPGTSPLCDDKLPRERGFACGNNPLCANGSVNHCDGHGECLLAECTACKDLPGMYGADCTCNTEPLTISGRKLDARCSKGTWFIYERVSGSLTIPPGITATFLESVIVPHDHTLELGIGSFIILSKCGSSILGTLFGRDSIKHKGNSTELLYKADCTTVRPSSITGVFQQDVNECSSLKISDSKTHKGFTALLLMTSYTCGKQKLDYMFMAIPILSVFALFILVSVVVLSIYRFKMRTDFSNIGTTYTHDPRTSIPMHTLSAPLLRETIQEMP